MINRKAGCVLWLIPGKIRVIKLGGRSGEVVAEFDWKNEDLAVALRAIKKKFGGKFDLLLDESFVYHLGLKLKAIDEVGSKLMGLVAERVPEDLGQTVWGYKRLGKTDFLSVVVVLGDFSKVLRSSLESEKIEVGRVETVPSLIARGLVGEGLSVLEDENRILVVLTLNDGVVLVQDEKSVTKNDILGVISYAQNTFGLNPVQINLLGKTGLEGEIFEDGKYKVVKKDFSLLNSMLVGEVEPIKFGINYGMSRGRNWGKLLVGGVVSLAVAVGLYLYINSQNDHDSLDKSYMNPGQTAEIEPISTPTVMETVEASKNVVKDKYSVVIENGSGIVGDAGKLKAILEAEGFKVIRVGNSDNQEYEDTEFRVKKLVEKQYFDTLDSVLLKTYTVVEGTTLSDNFEGDVLIVIGRKRK